VIIFGIFQSQRNAFIPSRERSLLKIKSIWKKRHFGSLPMILNRIQLVWFTKHKGIDFNEWLFMHQSLFSCLFDMTSHKLYEDLNARQWPA